jgi:amino acid permease
LITKNLISLSIKALAHRCKLKKSYIPWEAIKYIVPFFGWLLNGPFLSVIFFNHSKTRQLCSVFEWLPFLYEATSFFLQYSSVCLSDAQFQGKMHHLNTELVWYVFKSPLYPKIRQKSTTQQILSSDYQWAS